MIYINIICRYINWCLMPSQPVRLYQGGRCSQIFKLTQYNPYIYEENHMESALAKFHAFICKRLWGVASQISTHFTHILWNAVPIYTQIIIHISLQLPLFSICTTQNIHDFLSTAPHSNIGIYSVPKIRKCLIFTMSDLSLVVASEDIYIMTTEWMYY